jgi:hypothetical protein
MVQVGESHAYLALTMSNFEHVLVDEIRAKLVPGSAPTTDEWVVALDSTNSVLGTGNQPTAAAPGQAGVGKVVFYTCSPASDVLKLQAAQGLYALILTADDLGKEKAELDRIKTLYEKAEWENALKLWRLHQSFTPHRCTADARIEKSGQTFFRASCVRDGKHEFTSTDVSAKVGAAVLQKMGAFDEPNTKSAAAKKALQDAGGVLAGSSASDWSVSLQDYHVEVVTIILQRTLVAGLYLSSSSSLETPDALLVAAAQTKVGEAAAPAPVAPVAPAPVAPAPEADVPKPTDSTNDGQTEGGGKHKSKKRKRGADDVPNSSKSKLPKTNRPWITAVPGNTACLRPSIAHTLLQLARPSTSDVVIDTMAGVNTIPLEAAANGCPFYSTGGSASKPSTAALPPLLFAIGGEMEDAAVAQGGVNGSYLQRIHGRCADMTKWDATRLPLRDGSVDVVVVDLPFGVRCSKASTNRKLYPQALKEMARVVRGGGRVVLMTVMKKALVNSIDTRVWDTDAVHSSNCGGLIVAVAVLTRKARA